MRKERLVHILCNYNARTGFFVYLMLIFLIGQVMLPFMPDISENSAADEVTYGAITDYHVEPAEGDADTHFTFYATYKDPLNQSLTSVELVIDQTTYYSMTYVNGTFETGNLYKYSTKLDGGMHNYKIKFTYYFGPNGSTTKTTSPKSGPFVYSNEGMMNSTKWNETTKNCIVSVSDVKINATVSGSVSGEINFTDVKMVIIDDGAFDGKGFIKANWSATIETVKYCGRLTAMLYRNDDERKYYLQGKFMDEFHGTIEGILTESVKNSNKYDVFSADSIICKIRQYDVNATVTMKGTVDYETTCKYNTSIYIIQAAFSGNVTGYYKGAMNLILTHVRINNESDPYFNQGFSFISYTTVQGSGRGWTYDYVYPNHPSPGKNITLLSGYFTAPYLGLVTGYMNESGVIKTLFIHFSRINYDQPPQAKVIYELWGTKWASPGQTITYCVKYSNIGLKVVNNLYFELTLDSKSEIDVNYTLRDGTYNASTHSVSWTTTIKPFSTGYACVKVRMKWGLSQGTKLYFNLYSDKMREVLEATVNTTIIVARDPNAKHGPEGDIRQGQQLDYQIEYENEGKGIAFGVYFTDILDINLDDTSLVIGPVKSKEDNSTVAPPGSYDPLTRTVTWFVGELGPGKGGYTNLSVNARADAPPGTYILNYATVYFPSVPEETKTNVILSMVRINQPPVPGAIASRMVKTYEDVLCDASGSYDSDGEIVKYTWDFGDGNIKYGETVTHQYADDGYYNARLTVEDNEGLAAANTFGVKVQNRAPVADLTADVLETDTLADVSFDASGSADIDGIISEYFFDFGDGITSGWIDEPEVIHQYATGSSGYTAKVVVRDDDGAWSTNSAEFAISVSNRNPAAVLTLSKSEAQTYEYIECIASLSADADGFVKEYYFDFGDGEKSGWVASHKVRHLYTDGTNEYLITLKIKDDHGAICTAPASAKVKITNRKPVAQLAAGTDGALTYSTVKFDGARSSDRDGTIEYFFDYGDGENSGWTPEPVASHQYRDGTTDYTVTLSVRDDDGATASVSEVISIANRRPTADAEGASTAAASAEVEFSGMKSGDIDGGIVSYSWDFGDGNTAAGEKVSHIYTDDGLYIVTLTVTDDDGAADTDMFEISVTNNRPKAGFEANTKQGNVNTIFEFHSTSSDTDGSIKVLQWDLGDGTTSEIPEPAHQYTRDGIFRVSLIVIDDDGAKSDISEMVVVVGNLAPTAGISTSATSSEAGLAISFDGSGSYDPEGGELAFTWDFGDGGSTVAGKTVRHRFAEPGTYQVNLTVTDGRGESGSSEIDVKIEERTIQAKPITDDNEGIIPVAVLILAPIVVVFMVIILMILQRRPKLPEKR